MITATYGVCVSEEEAGFGEALSGLGVSGAAGVVCAGGGGCCWVYSYAANLRSSVIGTGLILLGVPLYVWGSADLWFDWSGSRMKARLGQNFLVDVGAQRAIADALGDVSQQTVVEIGPGRAAITDLLAARARRVVAIELDEALAGGLRTRFFGEQCLRWALGVGWRCCIGMCCRWI